MLSGKLRFLLTALMILSYVPLGSCFPLLFFNASIASGIISFVAEMQACSYIFLFSSVVPLDRPPFARSTVQSVEVAPSIIFSLLSSGGVDGGVIRIRSGSRRL